MNDSYEIPFVKIYVWDEKTTAFKSHEALNEALFWPRAVSLINTSYGVYYVILFDSPF